MWLAPFSWGCPCSLEIVFIFSAFHGPAVPGSHLLWQWQIYRFACYHDVGNLIVKIDDCFSGKEAIDPIHHPLYGH